jgi:aldehyde:ferredoxin oxidoreductase
MEAPHDPFYEGLDNPHNEFNQLGLNHAVDRLDLGPKKVQAFFTTQKVWSLYNCVGMCDFVGQPLGELTLDKLREYVNAATGWDLSLVELMKVGERANTMARLFNLREGFDAADDVLPSRMFEPLQNGALVGKALDRKEVDSALQLYYEEAGWNTQGVPTDTKLAELHLTGISDDIAKGT